MLGKEVTMQMPALRGDESVIPAEQPVVKDWSKVRSPETLAGGVVTGLLGLIYFISWSVLIMVSGPVSGTRKCGRGVLEMLTDIARIPRPAASLRWPGWRGANRFAAV